MKQSQFALWQTLWKKININQRWWTKWNINYKHFFNVHAVKMEICVTLYFLLIRVSKRHNTKLLDLIRSHANCIQILHIEHSKSVICVPWYFLCHLRSQLVFCLFFGNKVACKVLKQSYCVYNYRWSNRWTFLHQFLEKKNVKTAWCVLTQSVNVAFGPVAERHWGKCVDMFGHWYSPSAVPPTFANDPSSFFVFQFTGAESITLLIDIFDDYAWA